MHMTRTESAELAKAMVEQLKDGKHRYLVAPSFTNLETVGAIVKGTNIRLGAQNCQGAHTGEVSVLQLKDLGVRTIILGHSERRHVYKEDDGLINRKVRLALRHGFEVILCIGELLEEREAGKAEEVCKTQTVRGLEGVGAGELANLVIAYEPVWAIGTGLTASPEQAQEVCAAIRQAIREIYGNEVADMIRIQYGGSVNKGNARALFTQPDIDGGLVGGASLTADFADVVKY
jgi:triosephosphate isomerase